MITRIRDEGARVLTYMVHLYSAQHHGSYQAEVLKCSLCCLIYNKAEHKGLEERKEESKGRRGGWKEKRKQAERIFTSRFQVLQLWVTQLMLIS